jgi:hypothetical protein
MTSRASSDFVFLGLCRVCSSTFPITFSTFPIVFTTEQITENRKGARIERYVIKGLSNNHSQQ